MTNEPAQKRLPELMRGLRKSLNGLAAAHLRPVEDALQRQKQASESVASFSEDLGPVLSRLMERYLTGDTTPPGQSSKDDPVERTLERRFDLWAAGEPAAREQGGADAAQGSTGEEEKHEAARAVYRAAQAVRAKALKDQGALDHGGGGPADDLQHRLGELVRSCEALMEALNAWEEEGYRKDGPVHAWFRRAVRENRQAWEGVLDQCIRAGVAGAKGGASAARKIMKYEDMAIALLVQHPDEDWTNTRIAEELGMKNRRSIREDRWPRFYEARRRLQKMQQEAKGRRPRGRGLDARTGDAVGEAPSACRRCGEPVPQWRCSRCNEPFTDTCRGCHDELEHGDDGG